MSSSTTTQTTLDRREIHRQSERILNANFLHFIPISLLFLPITFSTAAAIQFYKSSAPSDITATTYFDPPTLFLIKTIIASSQTLLSLKTLIILLAFTFSVILPTVAGIALITYTTNQGIYNKHLTFSSTVKSLSCSYFPLLSTIIAGSIKLILISLLFTLSPIAITEAIKALGFEFYKFNNVFSIFINSIVFYVLAFTVVFFVVIWGSGPAIAVLELKSGLQPLRQSANQSTEFRSHSFSIVFLLGFGISSILSSSAFFPIIGTAANWISILNISFICLCSSLMILFYVVANTVLYVHCKVACGEEVVKSAVKGEVSGEYVKVAVDDGEDMVLHEQGNREEIFGGFTRILCVFLVLWLIIILRQKGGAEDLKFLKVVEAETQVVSGIKYYLKIEAVSKSGVSKVFDAEEVVKPWMNSKQLLNFKRSPARKRGSESLQSLKFPPLLALQFRLRSPGKSSSDPSRGGDLGSSDDDDGDGVC
ncbi:hypothetical protein L6452_13176 [Arctium lappa]|uniref:Uncharacterized protein n=1 Tax=Arctium lappa TaxID=4217 RepID=A0ACB9CHJ1_ARCLA|nr:hypothetical protein L6452_13176 [Arctium lappa]